MAQRVGCAAIALWRSTVHGFAEARTDIGPPLWAPSWGLLNGIITPNSLHFERHHSGIPEIDPSVHRLTIHGLVKQPLSFDLESLLHYPLVSRVLFMGLG